MNKWTACAKNAFDTYHYLKHLGIKQNDFINWSILG